jgi:predicted dehydrogenase
MTRVGIAGLGFMGMIHYLAYQKVRGAKVAAVCETDPKRLAGDWRSIKGNFGPKGRKMNLGGIARYSEIDQLLADPNIDLVDICLPPSMHARVAIAALRAGKHVFCEKPITLRNADAQHMVDAASHAGKLLMIGHVLPFFPEYRFAYEAIRDHRFGRMLGGHFKRIISDPLWLPDFYNPETIGGPMIDLHVHDAHFIRLVCGMPEAVQSAGSMRGEVVERFHSQFLFADRGLFVTAASGVINQQGRPFTHGFEIYLEEATLLYDYAAIGKGLDALTPLTVLTADGKVKRPKLGGGDPVDSFVSEIAEVVRSVESNTPSALLDGRLARDALLLCQKQTESVQRRRAVKV